MAAIKKSLRNTIDALSDEEARKVLTFARQFQKQNGSAKTLRRLANDPTFRVPSQRKENFRPIEPVKGKGIPASRLLVEDRR